MSSVLVPSAAGREERALASLAPPTPPPGRRAPGGWGKWVPEDHVATQTRRPKPGHPLRKVPRLTFIVGGGSKVPRLTYAQGSICPPWPTHPITFHGCPISLHGGYSTQSKTGYYPNRTRGCGGGSRDRTGHPGTYITPMQDPPPTLNRFYSFYFPPCSLPGRGTHSEHTAPNTHTAREGP